MNDEESGDLLGEVIQCLYISESLSLVRLLVILKKSKLEAARAGGDSDLVQSSTTDYARALELYRMAQSTFSDVLLRLQEIKLKLEGKYSTGMTEEDLINDVGWPARQWYLEFKDEVESLLAKI